MTSRPTQTIQQVKSPVRIVRIDAEQAGQRLDNFLRTKCKDLPKSHLYRIIRKGEVRVNKKRAGPEYKLQANDEVRIPPLAITAASEAKKTTVPDKHIGERLSQHILYEDPQILILAKPAGMAVHAGSGVKFGVIEFLRAARPHEKYLELVHRIDRETSGCLLLAKKPSILKECHALLREGKMTKRYLLLVKGRWPAHLKYIDQALQKNQLLSGERMVQAAKTGNGKESMTTFKVKQRFAQATLIEAQPQTGRTHQIRVHAAHAGYPIIGDDKYGDREFNKLMRAYGCSRLFLHAVSLEFTLPTSGKKISVEAELEEDLKKCLKRLVP